MCKLRGELRGGSDSAPGAKKRKAALAEAASSLRHHEQTG